MGYELLLPEADAGEEIWLELPGYQTKAEHEAEQAKIKALEDQGWEFTDVEAEYGN